MKPRALDLFSGAGGISRGLQEAGYYVVGVDLSPQSNYIGDEFHQADALTFPLEGFDFYAASPPCQGYSVAMNMHGDQGYARLIPCVRKRLVATGKPYAIENVIGAPLRYPVMLCGTMFGLSVYRHRHFETSRLILSPHHPKHRAACAKVGRPHNDGEFMSIAGHISSIAQARKAMGIDWMTREELVQAIPPSYAKFIGEQMLPHVLASMAHRRSA